MAFKLLKFSLGELSDCIVDARNGIVTNATVVTIITMKNKQLIHNQLIRNACINLFLPWIFIYKKWSEALKFSQYYPINKKGLKVGGWPLTNELVIN